MQDSYAEALNQGKLVVVYFRADWCSTCPPVEAALIDIVSQHTRSADPGQSRCP